MAILNAMRGVLASVGLPLQTSEQGMACNARQYYTNSRYGSAKYGDVLDGLSDFDQASQYIT
jgi:hypothetical protein